MDEKLLNGIVMLIIGICVIIKSKSFARICRENKIKIFGKARHDDASEFVARIGIVIIGLVGVLGGFLQFYRYFFAN